MSTNYYAHILPTKEKKKELHDAIEADDFSLIEKLCSEMYGIVQKDLDYDRIIGGRVHLGKASGGWKFLWNPNIYIVRHGHVEKHHEQRKWVEDPSTGIYLYPLTKRGLHNFIFRENVLVYDEYKELQNKEEFWQMALSWGYGKNDKGWDAASYGAYERKHNNYYQYPVTGELTDFLIREGYKFTSSSNSDFYSDGLRFAGFINFS